MENREELKGLVFDIDGTLCPVKGKEERYEDLVPYPEMLDKLKEYRNSGFKIILYTSRNMRTYNNNIGEINKNTLPLLIEWLKKWNIPYDEIHVAKPWPGKIGYYVDDRSIRPREFLENTPEELEKIIKKDAKI
ncbi:MAG: capsular biosynthesis protein [Rickettsiales bacterium]|jgi:capsule biosynthesis phosphatase|nr:capsular biosynthesis protein [Rickettsiales bacterium]